MRIVLDLQACQASSMNRGIGRYSLALALAMVRHGAAHDTRIVLNSGFPASAIALRKTFESVMPATAISSFVTPLPTAESDPDNRWRLLAAERIREHYLASLQPDIVQVTSLFEGFGDSSVNSVLHGSGRFDTAVTLYDLIPLLRKERYLIDPNLAAWYHRKLESLKQSQLLLAISGHARDEAIAALKLAPERVVDISSAADAIFTPRDVTPDARAGLFARHGLRGPFIMYTGGIDYRKNIEGLIEAYAALPGDLRRRYQLAVVCGIHDPDRVRLQRLSARLGLARDDLILTGFVSDEDLVALYNCTALFVFPSLHEGFGLPVLEAMACGAPVIGSNTSSIPEVLGRADAMFDPASVPAITAAIVRVLTTPAFAAELRAHGLAQARRFSWDASAKRAIAAFEETHRRRQAAQTVNLPVGAVSDAPRLRLALVAPPGTASAVAQGLAAFYAVDVLSPLQCSTVWLDAHGGTYDRLVYQFGDAAAYAPLFDLLERHPGIVLLHDFFLGNALDAVDGTGVLYQAHGYQALMMAQQQGRLAAFRAYPANRAVAGRALGVVVRSSAALALARQWYGPEAVRRWRVASADGAGAARLLHDAIEDCARDGTGAREHELIDALAGLVVPRGGAAGDWRQAAAAIAANRPRDSVRQLLVDVTHLTRTTLADPAGRAVGNKLVSTLIAAAPPHWRIEPVWHDGERYRYARRFTLDLIGCAGVALDDAVVDASAGDILLGAEYPAVSPFPPAWQACGVVLHYCQPQDGAPHDASAVALALLARLAGGALTPECT